MKDLFILMRPQQWLKNAFVFAPLFFNGSLTDGVALQQSLLAFAAYCLAAGAIYCFNDIYDREADRRHPVKRLRPIASGKVSVAGGCLLSMLLAACSQALVLALGGGARWPLAGCILFYLLMNVAYCTYLKRKTLVDIFIIAIGFVLRIVVGGVATGIRLSHWLVLMTFLLALFLALAKRRDDVVIYEETGRQMRKSITRYNLDFMNQSITVVASVNLVCYILYSVSAEVTERIGSDYLYATSVFVLLGLLRYMQLTIVDVRSGSPTHVLLHDRFIQCCVAGWGLLFAIILYV